MRPILTLYTVSLWNYKTIFPIHEGDIPTLNNLEILETFTGTSSESWFYLISVAIEARSAIILPLLISCLQAVGDRDLPNLILYLKSLANEIAHIRVLLCKLHSECCPTVFYNSIRPYLSGWNNSNLPNGVIYEGTSPFHTFESHGINREKACRTYAGGSNGQSPLIQALDIIMGIEHHSTTEGGGCGGFVHEMRKYMPGPHRQFLEDLDRVSNLREFVVNYPVDKGGSNLLRPRTTRVLLV